MNVQSITGTNNTSSTNFTAIDKVRKFGGFKKNSKLADTILAKMKGTEEVDTFCNKYNTTVLMNEYRVYNKREACVQVIYREKPTKNIIKNVLHAVRDFIFPRSVHASAKGATTEEAVAKLGEKVTGETSQLRTEIWNVNNGLGLLNEL